MAVRRPVYSPSANWMNRLVNLKCFVNKHVNKKEGRQGKMKTKKLILLVVALSMVALFTSYASAGDFTQLGYVHRVEVGRYQTYIYTSANHPCKDEYVTVDESLPDHDRILNAALTAMSFGLKTKFLIKGNSPCMAERIIIEK